MEETCIATRFSKYLVCLFAWIGRKNKYSSLTDNPNFPVTFWIRLH